MNSPRDLRRRIKSVGGTAQITKAMQMVAASKMRKAQDAALAGRPFVHLLYRIQRQATTRMVDFSHPLLAVRSVRKRAVILIAADKGLCGALNSNLFRLASEFDPQSTLFITAGRKAAQFIARTRRQLVAEFSYTTRHSFPKRGLLPPLPGTSSSNKRWIRSRLSRPVSSTHLPRNHSALSFFQWEKSRR